MAALKTLGDVRRRYGLAAATRLAAGLTLAKAGVRLIEVVRLPPVEGPPVPEGLEARFLTADEVRAFAIDPANDFDAEAAARVEAGGRCFGVLDGGRLAASGWYAVGKAPAEHCFGFGMRLPAGAAYMYKGFTHADYRGRRLHGLVMAEALRQMADVGCLVSTVEWTNAASIKSCRRLGYEFLGRVWVRGGRVLRAAGGVRRAGVEAVDGA